MLNTYSPFDEKIHIYGRTSTWTMGALPLFWTGSGVEFMTDGGEVWLDLESEYVLREEWIRVEVDGFCIQRCMVQKGRSKVCLFRGFSKDTVRRVRVLKEVQPKEEDVDRYFLVHGILCDGKLYDVPEKPYRIEIIGDSLSSGEGLSGDRSLISSCSGVFGLEGHYGIAVADHFCADFRIMSMSGWGVYCACNNSLYRTLPRYYEQVCGVISGEKNLKRGAGELHDFNTWQPDVVIVNLGSNDSFAPDSEPWINPEDGSVWKQCWKIPEGQKEWTHVWNEPAELDEISAQRFEQAVVDFLKKLRRNNPGAYLLWAYGMITHIMCPYLENAVRRYREETGDLSAEFISLPAVKDEWMGSNNHPGKPSHQAAAQVLIQKISDLWQKGYV